MNPKTTLGMLAFALLMLVGITSPCSTACAQGTAFTYQGRLIAGPTPVNGIYDLRFGLYDALPGGTGTQQGSLLTNSAVGVTNGLFVVQLDFGSQFSGAPRWLEIGVRSNGVVAFTTLAPRQPVTPTPYSIYAESAASLPGVTIQPNSAGAPDVILGSPVNFVAAGVRGATISGGGATNYLGVALTNRVTADFGTVGGGAGNTASGSYSTVPGGNGNTASGAYSFAAGFNANATNNGSFVWADYQPASGPFYSLTSNSFNVRAQGGVRLVTSGAGLSVDGPLSGDGRGLTNLTVSAAQLTSIGNGNIDIYGLLSSFNFFIGNAGNSTNTGSDNTAIGYRALDSNTTGFDNTASGYGALNSNTDGNYNTANGSYALSSNTTGFANTANGISALYNNTTGFHNIALGDSAGFNILTGSFNIDIGNLGATNDSGVIRIGDPEHQSATLLVGNVGIGTTTPGPPLDVLGKMQVNTNGTIECPGTTGSGQYGSFNGMIEAYYADNDRYGLAQLPGGVTALYTSSNYTSATIQLGLMTSKTSFAPKVTVTHVGNVGIGTTTANHLLVVGNSGSPAYCDGATWVNGSDRNSKEDFAAINPAEVLQKVAAMPITQWQYKVQPGEAHIGPMAQDFHAAFGLNGSDDKHISTVDEGGVALAAIQGLNQKLEEQKAENAELRARLDKLERWINSKSTEK